MPLPLFILFILIFIPVIYAGFFGAPWVPTPKRATEKMLRLAKIKPGEKIYDLGCGDGRLIFDATEKYQANAVGVELSPPVFAWCWLKKILFRRKGRIIFRNFWRMDFSDANVIFLYLLPKPLVKLQKKLDRELTPGTRVISYAFAIGDWEPIHIEPKEEQKNLCRVLVYEIGKNVKKC